MELTRTDQKKVWTNIFIFIAPVLLIYLGYVQTGIGDGFAWADFVPNAFVAGSITTYLISTLIDIIRKFIGSNGK